MGYWTRLTFGAQAKAWAINVSSSFLRDAGAAAAKVYAALVTGALQHVASSSVVVTQGKLAAAIVVQQMPPTQIKPSTTNLQRAPTQQGQVVKLSTNGGREAQPQHPPHRRPKEDTNLNTPKAYATALPAALHSTLTGPAQTRGS